MKSVMDVGGTVSGEEFLNTYATTSIYAQGLGCIKFIRDIRTLLCPRSTGINSQYLRVGLGFDTR